MACAARVLERVQALQQSNDALRDRVAELEVDGLTGLLQRAVGMQRLEHAAEYARRHRDEPLAVLLVDLDGLKECNDTLGHEAGDARIAGTGRALRGSLRPYDVAVRIGGDEFLCGLPGTAAAEMAAVVERLRARLDAEGAGSASIGWAVLRTGEPLGAAVKRADSAMYREKETRPHRGRAL